VADSSPCVGVCPLVVRAALSPLVPRPDSGELGLEPTSIRVATGGPSGVTGVAESRATTTLAGGGNTPLSVNVNSELK